MSENGSAGEGIYFSLMEIGLIIALSALAALTGALVPSYFFPEGRLSEYVYGMLKLPGPGPECSFSEVFSVSGFSLDLSWSKNLVLPRLWQRY